MAKAILLRPKQELYSKIKEAARTEQRKLAPTVLLILTRYFDGAQRKEQAKGD